MAEIWCHHHPSGPYLLMEFVSQITVEPKLTKKQVRAEVRAGKTAIDGGGKISKSPVTMRLLNELLVMGKDVDVRLDRCNANCTFADVVAAIKKRDIETYGVTEELEVEYAKANGLEI